MMEFVLWLECKDLWR